MKTIHLVFSAHLDPIWLWPWQAGLDETLATCRSACDRLDRHPDLVFTRGEAWVYEQVERVDPELFARIKKHVEAGRWEIVGGWWVQPDCNLPSYWAMQKQIALGKAYFEEKFGLFPRTAYNVDSFGHAAALPALMRDAGQDSYIMMRPNTRELELPARLFRWRGYENGPEVLTCRITSYITNTEIPLDYVRQCTELLPDGIDHALCFAGIGDHGGGPTEAQIAWCREHLDAIQGWRIVFSSPVRYFDAIRPQIDLLPIFTGELQPNAVGCYTAYRPIKVSVRSAEQRLKQAEQIASPRDATALTEAWKRVCFHHFHDTLGGTCLPSAYPIVLDQLGAARTIADEILQYGLRENMRALPDDPLQRVILYNASDKPFDDFIEFEPWVDWWQPWLPDCALIDENGARVPFQVLQSEALAEFGVNGHFSRLLFRARLGAGEMKTLRIEREVEPKAFESGVMVNQDGGIASTRGVSITRNGPRWSARAASPQFRLDLIDDPSNTWSHGVIGFGETPMDTARWGEPISLDSGPLMASLLVDGQIGKSDLRAEWRVYAGEPYADLALTVRFNERHKVLKLTMALPNLGEERIDGVMGDEITRQNSGAERPLRDWTLITTGDGARLGIVAPDAYAIDATQNRVRLTLLRSPLMAHHLAIDAPNMQRGVIGDQGIHHFRFRFFYGDGIDEALLEKHALALQRPPLAADLTRGMPPDFRARVKRTATGNFDLPN